jgi:putative DNA-invertase from lambdoid prophage Rac
MVWSIDRLGRSTAAVTAALAEVAAAGVAIFALKESVDATTPHGRAMLRMAAVFAELESNMIRERVVSGIRRAQAQGTHCGRPKIKVENETAVRAALAEGTGILKVAQQFGLGTGTVHRIAKEMRGLKPRPAAVTSKLH